MPTVSRAGGQVKETLLICELPSRMRLDTSWPSRRLRLDATPDRIAYDAASNTYAVLTSKQVCSTSESHALCFVDAH